MRKFLINTLLFLVVTIALALLLVSIITIRKNCAFRVENNVNTLFLGNSHLECAINDSIYPNSFNFARSGERMEWVYSKMVLLLDANPQIERVVIGFDNVLCFKNAKEEDVHMGHFSPYFITTLDFHDVLEFFSDASSKYNFDMYTKALNVSKLYEIYRESGNNAHSLSMGGFVPSDRDKLKEAIAIHQKSGTNTVRKFDDLSHYFLDKTIKECKHRGVDVIFVCAPQHRLIQNEDSLFREIYQKYYTDIPFYDYRNLALPDSAFQDLDHLNRHGARFFSEFLKTKLQ